MRKPVIAGNWKMNMLPDEAVALVKGIWQEIQDVDTVETVVCPPFVDVPAIADLIRNDRIGIGLGAQNMHWEESGAYTGEVSPLMLKSFEVTHVIIGHSERRQYFGETDQGVNRKVKSAISHGMVPIMCCGETIKQREAGETQSVVVNQVKCGLFELEAESAATVIIAYEPIWAIGTGKAATADDADVVCGMIRRVLSDDFGSEVSEAVRIQYGGSVTPDNISELMSRADIDGALVGGASLKPDAFTRIVRYS